MELPAITVAVPTLSPTPTAAPTPSDSPTPTPSPSPVSQAWTDWTFAGATMSVPKLGIAQAAITELQPNELVQKTYVNDAGEEGVYTAIDPAGKQTITWDTRVVDGVRYPVGSALTASAANTVYLYCHDYSDDSAICSTIYDVLVPGDTLVVETPTEVLTYTVQESFSLRKGELPNDARITAVGAGRLVVITCNSGGERNADGETMQNSAIVFQLTSASAK